MYSSYTPPALGATRAFAVTVTVAVGEFEVSERVSARVSEWLWHDKGVRRQWDSSFNMSECYCLDSFIDSE
jgi:hypothetical protein